MTIEKETHKQKICCVLFLTASPLLAETIIRRGAVTPLAEVTALQQQTKINRFRTRLQSGPKECQI